MLVSFFLLMLTVAWSLYDEFFGLRPWRAYQRDFTSAYQDFLGKQITTETKAEDAVYSSADYKKLKADLDAAEQSIKAKDADFVRQLALLELQRTAITPAFQNARGKVGALIYQVEIIPESDKAARDPPRRM